MLEEFLEILQYNAPRHHVNTKVMCDKEYQLAIPSCVEEIYGQYGTIFDIQDPLAVGDNGWNLVNTVDIVQVIPVGPGNVL